MVCSVFQLCPTLCDPLDYSPDWSGLPFAPPGDLPDPRMNLGLISPELADRFFTTSTTWEAQCHLKVLKKLYPFFPSWVIIMIIKPLLDRSSPFLAIQPLLLVVQSSPTLCDPVDCSRPGFPTSYLTQIIPFPKLPAFHS